MREDGEFLGVPYFPILTSIRRPYLLPCVGSDVPREDRVDLLLLEEGSVTVLARDAIDLHVSREALLTAFRPKLT